MHLSRPDAQTPRPLAVAVSLLAASVLLVGCTATGGDTAPTAPEPTAESGQGSGSTEPEATRGSITVSMAGQSFSFETAACVITEEDMVVHGPGRDDDSGEPAYLDLDLYTESGLKAGEVRIALGAGERFASAGDELYASIGEGEEHLLMYSGDGKGFQLDAQFRSATSGSPIGPGTVSVDCD